MQSLKLCRHNVVINNDVEARGRHDKMPAQTYRQVAGLVSKCHVQTDSPNSTADCTSKMSVLAMLQQCFGGVETHNVPVPNYQQHQIQEGKFTQLPDEVLEMVANMLNSQDLCSLRQSSKRLATMTIHLLAARCPSDRTCINTEESLTTLIKGSKIPYLNGTTTTLTLSAPSWGIPLASYDAGFQEVLLLRLTSLRLHSIRIVQSRNLLRFLTSHAATLRQLDVRNVHASDLQSWREILVHVAKMHRLQRLELRHLVYTADRTAVFVLPRSTNGEHSSALEQLQYNRESKLITKELSDPAVANSQQEIGSLIDEFFTETGELQKDFDHELLLANEQTSWVQMMKKRLLGSAISLR